MRLMAGVAVLSMPLQLGAGVASAEGAAVGQFELKTLESEAGFLEFQSQNAYAWGQPRRANQTD